MLGVATATTTTTMTVAAATTRPARRSVVKESRIGQSCAPGRRQVLWSSLLLTSSNVSLARGQDVGIDLVPYVDEKNGFTFLRPAQWSKVDKGGATVLFEDPAKRSNNVGVVVTPVRISSLYEFGSAEDVAGKLLQAEKKKGSTNAVELLKVESRQLHGTIPKYEIEYRLDSSRGVKRILAAVVIAAKRLYILNLAFGDEEAGQAVVAPSLKAIAESLDLVPS